MQWPRYIPFYEEKIKSKLLYLLLKQNKRAITLMLGFS